MIDFVKVDCSSLSLEGLQSNPLIETNVSVDSNTGEIRGLKNWQSAYQCSAYGDLNFSHDPRYSKTILSGSLPKFLNDGKHNNYNFSAFGLSKSIDLLTFLFGVNTSTDQLRNIEISITILIDVNSNLIMDNYIFHSKAGASIMEFNIEHFKGGAIKKTLARSQYRIKSYDQNRRHNKPNRIINGKEVWRFRFEVNFKKMEQINKLDIRVLDDLRIKSKRDKLLQLLLGEWDAIFLFDPNLRKEDFENDELYYRLRDAKEWKKMSSHQRARAKKSYNSVLERSGYNTKQIIRDAMEQVWYRLSTEVTLF